MSGVIFLNSIKDAAVDLVAIVPFLFITFFVIEFIEYFYFDKVSSFVKHSGKYAPLAGALVASFPQCGFSIIASVLYIKGIISRGTLLAIYLSTSDEAIPVLLSAPQQYKLVLPVILIKIIIGVIAGYVVDLIFPRKQNTYYADVKLAQKGCCEHTLDENKSKKDLIVHPIVHTFVISIFIFVITAFINMFIFYFKSAEALGEHLMSGTVLQPFMAAFFGLIPNCAVSVALITLFIKGSIAFSSLIAGLCSNSGLGVWVVITKNKDTKDSLLMVSLLFLISSLSGLVLYFLAKII